MISKRNSVFTNHSYLRIGIVTLILFSLAKFNFAQISFYEEGWKVSKDEVGIKIYNRQMK